MTEPMFDEPFEPRAALMVQDLRRQVAELQAVITAIQSAWDDATDWITFGTEARDIIAAAQSDVLDAALADAWDEGWAERQQAVLAYMGGAYHDPAYSPGENPYRKSQGE